MNYVVRLAILSGVLICPFFINAAVPDHIRSEIEQDQARRLQTIQNAKLGIQQLGSPGTLPVEEITQEKQCFPIEEVSFSGNTVFSAEQLLHLIDFKPDCLGLSRINNYLHQITNQYIGAGFITSRAFLIPQDLTTKKLEILILEGKLESLLFNGQPQGFLSHAFPHLSGKVLNLRDIEQGLDQINRLSRFNAQIKLLPGTKTGFSIVDIRTATGYWGKATLGVNNVGQDSTGEEQLTYTLTSENLYGGLEQLSLSGSKSTAWSNNHDSESLSLNIDIPFGKWNFSYRTSYSDYINNFEKNSFQFHTSGKTNTHNLMAKWLFDRDAVSKSSVTFGINHRREKNYFFNSRLASSSRNLSSAFLSFEYSARLGPGFFTVSPAFAMGTDWFGGESDQGKKHAAPLAQFNKLSLTTSYTLPVTPSLNLTSTVFEQWTDDSLYGSQRISIGGQYSVRGFKDTSISGDSGYYWRNEATWQVGQLPWLGQISLQWALDTGRIAEDEHDRFERGSLTGTSLSLHTRSKTISSHITAGVPLDSPGWLKADDYVIYYQLNLVL